MILLHIDLCSNSFYFQTTIVKFSWHFTPVYNLISFLLHTLNLRSKYMKIQYRRIPKQTSYYTISKHIFRHIHQGYAALPKYSDTELSKQEKIRKGGSMPLHVQPVTSPSLILHVKWGNGTRPQGNSRHFIWITFENGSVGQRTVLVQLKLPLGV